jgi:hypothetical protein
MTSWNRRDFKLRSDHRWRAKPGHKILVADRGALRFEYPEKWIVEPGEEGSIRLFDGRPPNDNCRLEVSVIYLPPIDWSSLPLSQLIKDVISNNYDKDVISRGRVHQVKRPGQELAWMETAFIDATERREAFSRLCLGRGSNIQSLITMDFWADDAERLHPVWDGVLNTLELGRYIEDPTLGPGR